MVVAGCGRSNAPAKAASGAPGQQSAGKAYKVALILSGSGTDHGWNQDAVEAVHDVQTALSLPASSISIKEEAVSPSQQQDNLRAYAGQGYNLIIGHGEEYQAPALHMAPQFPNSLFVISSGDKMAANVTPIVFKLEDGAYLLGMLAGGMSRTGKIAEVGAQEIAPVRSVFTAFALGAKAVNPNITILHPVYTNDWEDIGKATQATQPLIQQGADVIIQDLDSASQGVFNAVQQASTAAHPVYALGTNNNQNSAAPGVVLASAPINCSPVFVSIAKQAEAGTFKPTDTPYGLPQGVIGYIENPALASRIPASLQAKIDAAEQAIKSGKLVVPMKTQ
jgi:basic membrane lipoprotein Med (substrate-binding protein (PBP1-ABC) superfamily)